jgi:hypothetical protein
MSQDPYMSRFPDAREWVVSRWHHDRRRLVIRHSDGSAPPVWIAKLRKLRKTLQKRSPSDLLDEVRRTGAIDLGILPGREAYPLTLRLREEGFDVQVEDASFISHFPMCAGSGLIISDHAESEAFCLKLIKEGARVEEIQD